MKTEMKNRALAAGACALVWLGVACGGGETPKEQKSEPAPVVPAEPAVIVAAPVEATPFPSPTPVPGRELNFPPDRSLGSLRTYDAEKGQWVNLGEAQGTVSVAGDAGVTLIVSAEGVKDLSSLAGFPSNAFRQIVFDGLEVPDAQLAHLAGLTELQKISFRAGQVTDTGIAVLGNLVGLTELDLAMTPISDAAIKPLTNLQSLDTLDISATNVSDAAIPDLTGFMKLRNLDPQRSKMTPEGVLKLKEALPDLTIVER